MAPTHNLELEVRAFVRGRRSFPALRVWLERHSNAVFESGDDRCERLAAELWTIIDEVDTGVLSKAGTRDAVREAWSSLELGGIPRRAESGHTLFCIREWPLPLHRDHRMRLGGPEHGRVHIVGHVTLRGAIDSGRGPRLTNNSLRSTRLASSTSLTRRATTC